MMSSPALAIASQRRAADSDTFVSDTSRRPASSACLAAARYSSVPTPAPRAAASTSTLTICAILPPRETTSITPASVAWRVTLPSTVADTSAVGASAIGAAFGSSIFASFRLRSRLTFLATRYARIQRKEAIVPSIAPPMSRPSRAFLSLPSMLLSVGSALMYCVNALSKIGLPSPSLAAKSARRASCGSKAAKSATIDPEMFPKPALRVAANTSPHCRNPEVIAPAVESGRSTSGKSMSEMPIGCLPVAISYWTACSLNCSIDR